MKIRQGDVIMYPVTGRSGLTSKLVAIGELLFGAGHGFEQYSHVAIASKRPGYQWEWKWPWSGEYHIDKNRPYEVWRIGNPTEEQREKILEYCARHRGEWYNMIGLLTFGLLGLKRTAVCSQGAGRAYAHAGIRIGAEGKPLLSPNAIADKHVSRMMDRVEPGRK